jgi:acyl carrier protein
MDRAEVEKALSTIFLRVFGRPVALRDSLTANDVDGWDSLTNVRLLDAVERQFKISISVSEVMALESVGSLIDTIHAKVTSGA